MNFHRIFSRFLPVLYSGGIFKIVKSRFTTSITQGGSVNYQPVLHHANLIENLCFVYWVGVKNTGTRSKPILVRLVRENLQNGGLLKIMLSAVHILDLVSYLKVFTIWYSQEILESISCISMSIIINSRGGKLQLFYYLTFYNLYSNF